MDKRDVWLKDFNQVFGSEAGQRVLDVIKTLSKAEGPIVSESPYQTYYNLGKRDLYMEILKVMEPVALKQVNNERRK